MVYRYQSPFYQEPLPNQPFTLQQGDLDGYFNTGADVVGEAASDYAKRQLFENAAAATGGESVLGTTGMGGALKNAVTAPGGWAALPAIGAGLYGAATAAKFGSGKKLSNFDKAALALPTAGLSLFSDKLQDAFGLGPRTTIETDKWKDLLDDQELLALVGPQAAQQLTTDVTEAPIRQDLPGGFVGFDPQTGEFVNNAFNNTRDESLLRPEDLLLYQDLVTTIDPKKYFGGTHQNRLDLAAAALGGGVNEAKGTITLSDVAKEAVRNKAKELGLA